MAIRWDKFTVKGQEAVQRASELASEHGNPELLPLHMLAALVEDREGIVPPVLEKIGIGVQSILNDVYKEMDRLPKLSGGAAQFARYFLQLFFVGHDESPVLAAVEEPGS